MIQSQTAHKTLEFEKLRLGCFPWKVFARRIKETEHSIQYTTIQEISLCRYTILRSMLSYCLHTLLLIYLTWRRWKLLRLKVNRSTQPVHRQDVWYAYWPQEYRPGAEDLFHHYYQANTSGSFKNESSRNFIQRTFIIQSSKIYVCLTRYNLEYYFTGPKSRNYRNMISFSDYKYLTKNQAVILICMSESKICLKRNIQSCGFVYIYRNSQMFFQN